MTMQEIRERLKDLEPRYGNHPAFSVYVALTENVTQLSVQTAMIAGALEALRLRFDEHDALSPEPRR